MLSVEIEQFQPDIVFTGLLDSETFSNRVGGQCVYECPRCGYRIRFRWRDFLRSDERPLHKRPIRQQFDRLTPDQFTGEHGKFDFGCPSCHAPTRILFSAENYRIRAYHYEIQTILVGARE